MNPTVEIVYVYPTCGEQHTEFAWRFLRSYFEHPPLAEHSTTVVLNGGHQAGDISSLFNSMPGVKFLVHDDSGWDIGAYQAAAKHSTAEMIVFFGGPTYFRKAGWLNRMATAFRAHGKALYGACGNRGDRSVNVWPHVRTTGFWLSPALFNQYPQKVTQPEQRYPFEHGVNSLTQWVYSQGLKVWVVAFEGEYEWANWDDIPNGFHRGNQSNLLVGDRLTEPPFYPHP